MAEHKNWAWRTPRDDRERADADEMRAYMRVEGIIRTDVPQQERAVYEGLYEYGHSLREVANTLGIAKPTAAVYLRRLRERLDKHRDSVAE